MIPLMMLTIMSGNIVTIKQKKTKLENKREREKENGRERMVQGSRATEDDDLHLRRGLGRSLRAAPP
jgi:hypothetical protein